MILDRTDGRLRKRRRLAASRVTAAPETVRSSQDSETSEWATG